MHPRKKIILPLLIIFLIFSASLPLARPLLAQWGINSDVLIVANILFFAVSLIAFFMQQKALQNINPNVFVRSVMAGMLIKMFEIGRAHV